MRRYLAVSLVGLAVAGCVGPPQAPEAPPAPVVRPAPLPTPPPPAPLASDWNDWPFTPGDWAYRVNDRGSVAQFGAAAVEPAIMLRCDRVRRTLELFTRGAPGNLTVRTTTLNRTLVVAPSDRESGYAAVQIGANEMLLDAMAFSRGRFVVERSGQPPLVLPPYAEIGRVIEDCRG